MKIYINGEYFNKENAKISVFDHGLLYGDGVFEGIRAYDGRVFKLYEHIERLFESAKSIMLDMPMDRDEMCRAVVETCRENKIQNGYIRLVVTRGIGSLGLNPFTCEKPQVIIIADKIALYPKKFYKDGLSVVTVPTPRNATEAINPRIKSLNYLNNILAKIEASNSGYLEAIMLDPQGYVAECTGDNIFMVKNNILSTPSQGRLEGITRDAVLQLAKQRKIEVSERLITRHEVYVADECFLTGTAAEIIPVVKVDGRVIGNGKPGGLTQAIMKSFRYLTKKDGVKYQVS